MGLRRSEPAAVLVVQAIDIDPHADEATIALDWVDLFDGNDPKVRFQPHDPAGWTQIDRDLIDAAVALENDGWRSVLVRGALRQATFFRVGTVLPGDPQPRLGTNKASNCGRPTRRKHPSRHRKRR